MIVEKWMSQKFFLFFLTWGIFLPYWTGWLIEAKEMSVANASILMSFGLIVRGASTLFAYPLASKLWSNKYVIILFTVSSLAAALLYIPAQSLPMLFIVTMLFHLFFPALLPAYEATASILVQHEGLQYGKSRSFGSLGFIVSVLIVSLITGYFGDESILWAMIIGLTVILLHNQTQTPTILLTKPGKTKGEDEKKLQKSLWNVQGFPLVLLIVVLLQAAHASYYNYGYIYLQELGVSKYFIGLIINIGVIFEILIFAKADFFFKQWNPSALFTLAAAGSTLRWLLIYLFPNVFIFILSQTLHAISFGVAHYAFILYITRNLPKDQIPQAQGLYSTFALSWGTAVLTLFGGILYEVNPSLSFLGMIVCTIPALALSFQYQAMTKKHPMNKRKEA